MNQSAIVRLIDLEILFQLRRHGFINHFVDECARVFRIDHFVPICVNDFALHVHHVVEVERPFADQVIALFDALLRRLDRFVQPAMLQLLAFFEPEALHDLRHSISCAEIAHEIVFEADIKA